MSTLELKGINKIYPNGVQAVFDFNIKIEDKEFIVFVGPSGCGKSTTLRMIAGLEDISSGELLIDNVVMNDVEPKDRNIAMVFQSYALYPHMTVYDNMAFALKLRRMSKEDIAEKVNSAAELLGLKEYLMRKPKALSGGQRQRVALGRAIVRDAKVFLMDEPLSNLDAKLRVTMRGEIIKLHNKLKATTIYVTHDQVEAMTMATRIVIMKDGYIQQIGTPKEVYEKPCNKFVASFIGMPSMNFIHGSIDANGVFTTLNKEYKLIIPKDKFDKIKENGIVDKNVIVGIRPEHIYIDKVSLEKYKENNININVDMSELLGQSTNIYAKVGNDQICAVVSSFHHVTLDEKITLALNMEKCHIFDSISEECII